MTIDHPPETSAGAERPAEAGVRRTLEIARPATGRLALATALGAATVAAGIGLLATSAWLIARSAQHPPESAIALAVAAVQFFALTRGLGRYAERLVGHDAALRALADVRVRVYEQLERLAPAGLAAYRRGDLLARLVQDVDTLQDLLLRVIPPFAIAATVGAATVGVVWWMLPGAGLVLLVTLALAAALVPWLTRRLAHRAERTQATARGELTASLVDLLEGAPDLVAYGAVSTQLARVETADAALTRISSAAARTRGIGLGLTTLLTGLAMWGALVVGIVALHGGRFDGVLLGVVALIPLAAFELVAPLPAATQTLEGVRQAAARLFAVLDATPPITEPAVPATIPLPPTPVETRSAAASYGEGPRALVGVDVTLGAGARVAVVGPSGAGKSTLAAVLVRFLDYTGSITFSGAEANQLDTDGLREIVGLLTQDVHLFDTTIAENLRIARRSASETDLREALADVGLGEWLATLRDGLATSVGEHGAELSGGQRQRLALARAALAGFPVLVLDEPTEHLDAATADAITAQLLGSRRTTLLITHRLAGLESVDQVLVMDSGRVVECGTHAELIAAGGLYATLWSHERETAAIASLATRRGALARSARRQ